MLQELYVVDCPADSICQLLFPSSMSSFGATFGMLNCESICLIVFDFTSFCTNRALDQNSGAFRIGPPGINHWDLVSLVVFSPALPFPNIFRVVFVRQCETAFRAFASARRKSVA